MSATILEAVARTESGLSPWALHDNTTGFDTAPASSGAAQTDAAQWISKGDSVDIGLMQINTANLPALGMSVATALDPCASLAGGAAVLEAAYGGGTTPADQQAALLMALSRYNTGTPLRGIMNGYARTVLQYAGTEVVPGLATPGEGLASAGPGAPPPWNITANGAYAQAHGAAWLVALTPSESEPATITGGAATNPTTTR